MVSFTCPSSTPSTATIPAVRSKAGSAGMCRRSSCSRNSREKKSKPASRGGVEGFADASEAMNVTAGLLERGYSEEDVAKIWGGNFLRVLRAAELARSATD